MASRSTRRTARTSPRVSGTSPARSFTPNPTRQRAVPSGLCVLSCSQQKKAGEKPALKAFDRYGVGGDVFFGVPTSELLLGWFSFVTFVSLNEPKTNSANMAAAATPMQGHGILQKNY